MGAGTTMYDRPHDGGATDCHNRKNNSRRRGTMERSARAGIFTRRIFLASGVAIAAALTASPFDQAHAAWPERTITLVACFPAGGGTDIAARLINTPLG